MSSDLYKESSPDFRLTPEVWADIVTLTTKLGWSTSTDPDGQCRSVRTDEGRHTITLDKACRGVYYTYNPNPQTLRSSSQWFRSMEELLKRILSLS